MIAENDSGQRSRASCYLATYDVTLPGGRFQEEYITSSNPAVMRASITVYEDSDLQQSMVGVGFGKDIYGDQVISWADVSMKEQQHTFNIGYDPFNHEVLRKMFTGSRTGRLIAPKAGPDTTKNSPGDCARACADLPHTKCMSFNYDFGKAKCELVEAIEGHDYKRSKSGLFEHYERLGVGKTKQFVYDQLILQHNKIHYFNFMMVNVLAYTNIISSRGVLVDLTTPLTGLIKNASADYLEIVPCLSMIPEQNRPDWKIWCKGINPKVKNHRLIIDGSGSLTVFNGPDPMTDLRYTRANRYISANWDGFNDKESGLLGYTITVGKQHCEDLIHPHHDPHKHLFDKSQWTNSAMISPIPAPYTILPDGTYFITVRALNEVKYGGPLSTTVCHTTPYIVDNSPPFVWEIFDINYDEDTLELTAKHNSSDPDSGLESNDLCFGHTTRDCDEMEWTRLTFNPNISYTKRLSNGIPIWIKIKAVNRVDLRTIGVADQAIIIDKTPPEPGTVNDGPLYGTDLLYTKNFDTLCANWLHFYDPESGIAFYMVSAGSLPDINVTDIANLTQYNRKTHEACVPLSTGQYLEHGKTYYTTVWAYNGAIRQRNCVGISNGVTVDLTKPVPGQVVDGNVTGFKDIEFSPSPAKVEVQWRNYYDPESTIKQYEVQVERAPHPDDNSSITDPYLSDIVEIQGHNRYRRGFWEGLEFRLAAPSVDWQMKVGTTALGASFGVVIENYLDLKIAPLSGHFKVNVHDEAYANLHIGMIGFSFSFFSAKLCYKGDTGYSFNIFQIADLRSRARKAVKALGRYDELQLPSFLKPVKSVIHRVEKLFNDIKTDVMTFYNKLDEVINVKLPVMGDKLYQAVLGIIDGFKIIGKNPKSAVFKIGLGVYQVYCTYKEAVILKNQTEEACFFLKDEKPYWWNITDEFKGIIEEANIAIQTVKRESPEWIEDFKEDPVSTFTNGKYSMAKLKEGIKNEIITTLEELMNPFDTILKNLAGPFFEAYETVFGIIKSVKEAYATLKNGYQIAKSLLNVIFGTKAHPDFPRTTRLDTDGCRGKGFYPSRLMSGDPEYSYSGVDLEINAGDIVVAPFSGDIMLTDSPNEVVIKTDDSFKNAEVYITNVNPKDTILHPSDENYIEHTIWAGVTIGTATSSPCKNHIKKDGGFVEPTRFLENRRVELQPYIQHCNDYRVEIVGITLAVGKIPDEDGEQQVDETPKTENTDVEPIDPPDESEDPGTEIRAAKSNPKSLFSKAKNAVSGIANGAKDMFTTLMKKADSFFKKFSLTRLKLGSIIEFLDTLGMTESKQHMAEVLKSIKKLIDNRPCLNPAQATEEELKQELFDRGHATTGTREQMITRLTKPDNRCPWMAITTPDNIYCTYDSMCLGVECCLNVKLFMFLYTVKAYARYDPCDYTLNVGLGDDSYSVQFDMGYDGVSDEIVTGFDVDLLDLVCLIKYDIQKTDIGLIASVGVAFCDGSDTDNCVAYISLLANAVLPIPICKSDGTISWPQDCKTIIPVDVIFVIDESGSVGEDHFRDSMNALVNAVEKLAIAENYVRVGVSLFAGAGTSRPLLQLNSEYDKEAVKQVLSEAVYQKGSYTEIGDAFQYVCDDMFIQGKGDRSDAQNYLILLTDGKSNSGADPVRVQAAACKTKGIRIATVGIGSNTDEDLLKEVAYSMPNYYLSTDYDKLPETLPNLVIQTMDCSTEWVLNFEYKDFFDIDAIKSRIEKAAKKKLLEAVDKLQDELLKALGLPEGFLQSTGPCVRPDKMKSSQLKKELENRGLSTTGSNEDLVSRLQTDDRRCETIGTPLYLPEITNPWLKDHLYYSISNDCLRLDVCVDISFTISSFDYSKSFNAFLELDFCKFLINFGIESETKSVILISYNWGQLETLTVTKDFQVLLSIDKDTDKKVFKLDFGLRICFEGDCVIDQMFLEDHEIPIPICNENFTFSGDSILALVQSIGGKMTEDVFDMVLKYLGLDKHFKTGQCNVQEGPKDCPGMINPQKYLPASIRTMLQCEMTDNCFGLDCCIDLSFQLPLGDRTVTYHIPFWFKFEPCDFEVDVRFGGYTYKKIILDYDWGEKNVLSIGNGDPAPVIIEYTIDKMEDSQGFKIDAKIIICFPVDGELFCAPDGGIHILKQQNLPVCSQEFYDWIKDCKTITPADVVLVLDESGSVGQDQFTLSLEAISETTDKLAIGENLIRVGISMFGGTGTPRTGFDLDTSYDKTVISQNVLQIAYNKQGYTDIGDALRYACEDMFVSSKGDRGDVKNYVVLMTDGQSNRGNTQTGVNTCRNNGVTIIAVGIGDGISRTELLSVVQDPNHFINTTYVELQETLPDIVTKSIDCSAGRSIQLMLNYTKLYQTLLQNI
ncbi:Hypothetical predicted protein [Mytilus galloprovincialis]|uniref:VWFA domain-containing protein n=1 Tax=Mytilus galloprovincialis TaxID=29158 RepID=A0A8B6EZ25_MYTGA|nr:Hypothetical predicted protein [Mytilus galloprovincialis]